MSYMRDSEGVIINTDDSYYRSLVATRESKKQRADLEAEVHDLKSELSEIKTLIAQLVHRNN